MKLTARNGQPVDAQLPQDLCHNEGATLQISSIAAILTNTDALLSIDTCKELKVSKLYL